MVRTRVPRHMAIFLAGLIAACPVLCEATEAGHAAHRHGPAGPTPGEPAHPHGPQEADACICGGAVEGVAARVPDADPASRPFPPPARTSRAPLPLRDGPPGVIAGRGGPSSARALLQIYRC